jgi:hypothetical protein
MLTHPTLTAGRDASFEAETVNIARALHPSLQMRWNWNNSS